MLIKNPCLSGFYLQNTDNTDDTKISGYIFLVLNSKLKSYTKKNSLQEGIIIF